MTEETKTTLKRSSVIVAFFFAFSLAIAAIHYSTQASAERAIRSAAQTTLAAWAQEPPKLGDRVEFPGAALSFPWVFESPAGKGHVGYVFVAPLTGNAGPMCAVFYFTDISGTRFCGFAGISGAETNPERYGITSRIISAQSRKIDQIARNGEGDGK